jgi:Cytochrome P460
VTGNVPRHLRANRFIWVRIVAGVLMLIAVAGFSRVRKPAASLEGQSSRAVFDADGRAHLPDGYRRWANVGTRYKASGRNILDGKPIVIPELMNTYVEPSALNHYKETGKWLDGAQIVKELSDVRVGKDCDTVTHICSSPIGPGIFQERYAGVGMMVKDAKRFPDAPGNWGYFGFLQEKSGYETVAEIRPQDQCASCHVRLASDTDYVISKAHLGLSARNIQ